MSKILQSVPYPTYSTIERDALTGVLKNYKINNSTTGVVEEWDGSGWIPAGSGTVNASEVALEPVVGFNASEVQGFADEVSVKFSTKADQLIKTVSFSPRIDLSYLKAYSTGQLSSAADFVPVFTADQLNQHVLALRLNGFPATFSGFEFYETALSALNTTANWVNIIVFFKIASKYYYTIVDAYLWSEPDVDAPILTSKSVSSITGSSAVLNATSNEVAIMYWAVKLLSEGAPTVSDIINGIGTVCNGSGAMAQSTAEQIAITGLLQSIAYKVYFIAIDQAGNQSAVASLSFTTTSSVALSAPTNLAATPSYTSIALSWDNVANNSGYEVYMSTAENGTYNLIETNVANDVTSTITGLTEGVTRWFKVLAIGQGAYSNSPLSAAISSTTLAIPVVNLRSNGTTDYVDTNLSLPTLVNTDRLDLTIWGADLIPSVQSTILFGAVENLTPVVRLMYMTYETGGALRTLFNSANAISNNITASAVNSQKIRLSLNGDVAGYAVMYSNDVELGRCTLDVMSAYHFNGTPPTHIVYAGTRSGNSATKPLGNCVIDVNRVLIEKNGAALVDLRGMSDGTFYDLVTGQTRYNRGLSVNTYPLTVV